MFHNPCIKTGALVKVEPYGAYIRCNVFRVDNCLIFTGFDRFRFPEDFPNESEIGEPHACIDISFGLCKEPQNFIVISKEDAEWSEDAIEWFAEQRLEYDSLTPF